MSDWPCPVTMSVCELASCRESCMRIRVRLRMQAECFPVGTDDPLLLALGAQPLLEEE
jgi:hypothetical protein